MAAAEVVMSRVKRAVTILLNRPKALNALRLTGVRLLAQHLTELESHTGAACVIMKGAGGRAFCAGGDIKTIYEQGRAGDHEGQLAFFREEYAVDHRLAVLNDRVPQVALWDGTVMGGGVGLSIHARFRVASEKAVFAMPETSIGFLPDVGGSWFLNRLPPAAGGTSLGLYLALTGARVTGGALVKAGLATHYVPSQDIPALEAALHDCTAPDAVAGAVASFAHPPPPASVDAVLSDGDVEDIRAMFSGDDVHEVRAACGRAAARGSKVGASAASALGKASPTSMAVAVEQLRQGRTLRTLAECFALEYRLVQFLLGQGDFYEGVRAALVDKDGAPRWAPPRLEDVDVAPIRAAMLPGAAVEELRLETSTVQA